MRILYVTQIVPYPPHGGVLQRGYNLLRELGRRHDVHLLAFHHRDELPPGGAVEESRRELGAFCAEVEYFDLWPKRSPVHKLVALALAAFHPQPFSLLAHRSAALQARIKAICGGDQRPDVVHLDTIALAPYLSLCGEVPVVMAHHNIESQLMRRRSAHETGALQRLYTRHQAASLQKLEARFAGQVKFNITVSEADATDLERICPGAQTVVIPNGADTEYFYPRWEQEGLDLIFTGGMNMFANRDGVDWFLEAVWPEVKARVPGVRFIAIGQRPSAKLLEAAERDDSVQAPGFVEDVRPAVARAGIYVVPLRVGGGTRLKVLDAMAQGKAIVSTSLGAEGIDVEDGNHLILADDAQSFADRIVELLGQPEERKKLGLAARARVEDRYSWAALAERLGASYAGAVEGQFK